MHSLRQQLIEASEELMAMVQTLSPFLCGLGQVVTFIYIFIYLSLSDIRQISWSDKASVPSFVKGR